MDQTQQLTEVSAQQLNFVTQEKLTAREAVAFLRSGMRLRTFRDILRQVCGTDALETPLVWGLCNLDPTANIDSVRRKVRNWMNGKSLPTEREDVFRICFALNLNMDQSSRMLTLLTEQGIHFRNIREMTYAYCLNHRLGYDYAQHLVAQVDHKKGDPGAQKEPVTHLIRQQFRNIHAEEDLFSFIMRNRENLGTHHNTAYSYFCKMLTLLTGEDMEGEEQYSMEYVADNYLRLNVPQEKKTGRYTDIQKMVKKKKLLLQENKIIYIPSLSDSDTTCYEFKPLVGFLDVEFIFFEKKIAKVNIKQLAFVNGEIRLANEETMILKEGYVEKNKSNNPKKLRKTKKENQQQQEKK